MRYLAFAITLGLAAFTGCGDSDDNGGTDTTGGGDTTGDTTGGGDTSNGGSLTQCDLSYELINAQGKAFGAGCENDNECQFGECLVPGTGGNITNNQFGFCTRGCDCDNAVASQIPDGQEEMFDCLYPSGFKDVHHIVVQCNNVAECQALDARWTDCKLPDTGGARKVCHAL